MDTKIREKICTKGEIDLSRLPSDFDDRDC